MTEKVLKINEKLEAVGHSLDTVSHDQFDDIARSVGLHRPPPPAN
jgi:tRNA A37 threonylcarbamoyltransferase TsaD